jgi:hypothetical protein
MKRRIVLSMMAVFIAGQTLAMAEEPQIAFRLLDDYVQRKQALADRGRVAGGTFSMVTGALLVGCSAFAWFAGDMAYSQITNGQSLNPNLKLGITVGAAAGGTLLIWAGADQMNRRSRDFTREYLEVYGEGDPSVQEAMAAATLRSFYERGKNRRLGSAVSKLSVSAVSLAITIGGNLFANRAWSDSLSQALSWQVYNLGGAMGDIFSRSEEEILYEKYLAARETLYSASQSDMEDRPLPSRRKDRRDSPDKDDLR